MWFFFFLITTGENGTIDGQGKMWWELWWNRTLVHTRGHLIEIKNSHNILISNLTLLNSPFWTIHPVYCRFLLILPNCFPLHLIMCHKLASLKFKITSYDSVLCSNVVIRDMTILAPMNAPNTDGIDPGKDALFWP